MWHDSCKDIQVTLHVAALQNWPLPYEFQQIYQLVSSVFCQFGNSSKKIENYGCHMVRYSRIDCINILLFCLWSFLFSLLSGIYCRALSITSVPRSCEGSDVVWWSSDHSISQLSVESAELGIFWVHRHVARGSIVLQCCMTYFKFITFLVTDNFCYVVFIIDLECCWQQAFHCICRRFRTFPAVLSEFSLSQGSSKSVPLVLISH